MLGPVGHIVRSVWSLDFDGLTAKLESIGRFLAFASVAASAAANFLPSWESLAHWPRTQAVYKGFVKVTAAAALNFRRRLPSLDLPFMGMHTHCSQCQALADAAERAKAAEASAGGVKA